VTFEEFRYFKHAKSCTLWLHPKQDTQVKQLQSLLEKAFPFCDDLSSRGEVRKNKQT